MTLKDYLELMGPGKSELETLFALQLKEAGLPEPEREYRFHPKRKWRFDFCYPLIMLAIEIDGGTFKKSRHTSGPGYHKDCKKLNAALIEGWRVLRFDSQMVNSGEAVAVTRQVLNQ